VFGREKKNREDYGTSACAGQAAVKRKKFRSHNDLTLPGAAWVSIQNLTNFGPGGDSAPSKKRTF
jgi:hypothetical protein